MKKISLVFLVLLPFIATAQIIKGSVMDANLNPFPKVVIKVKNKSTRTDSEGRFIIRVEGKYPHYLTFSALGYETEITRVDSEGEEVSIIMKEIKNADALVVSASRTSERALESPVTVGRLSISEIEQASSNSFYEEIELLKGVNKLESGFNFQSLNTRGFAGFNNKRFVQFVDGCDNALPALNYSQGNVNGVSDLDIAGAEILHGASSALYGANAYNGLLLLTTKNPFDHPGIAIKIKSGVTRQKEAGVNAFYDTSLRMAHQFNSFFAAKLNYTYRDSEEWHANDLRSVNDDFRIGKVVESSPGNLDYNGLNTYGDELVEGVIGFDKKLTKIRRIGYHEKDLIEDFRNKNRKISSSFHFRFLESYPLEFQLGIRHAKSNSIDPFGGSKLVKRDFVYNQYRAELKSEDFYIRAYQSRNDAGKTYDIGNTAHYLNEKIDNINKEKGTPSFSDLVKNKLIREYNVDLADGNWYKAYNIKPEDYKFVKQYAHRNQYNFDTKSTEFRKLLGTITEFHNKGGSQLYDKSYLNHFEGNYNFKKLLNEWFDFQIGGSYRQYTTDTKGTILNDLRENIRINEFGTYAQIKKGVIDERLILTSSIRYDKSKNFEGGFSPRVALNIVLGKDKNHVVRGSYQSAFRNPSIQEQYLNTYESGFKTIGFIEANLDKIAIEDEDYLSLNGDKSLITGGEILNNSVVSEDLRPANGTKGVLVKNKYETLKNESVNTVEFGYRGMVDITYSTRIDVDFDAFYSVNKDFMHRQKITVSKTGVFFPKGERAITKIEKDTLYAEINRYKSKPEYYEQNIELGMKDLVKNDVQVMDLDAYLDLVNGNEEEINILVNSKDEIQSYGFSLSLNSKLADKYDVGVNYSYIDFDKNNFRSSLKDYKKYIPYIPPFNTPKHTFKTYIGANGVYHNAGFKLNLVWQDKYHWIGSVRSEIPSRMTINGHINYLLPMLKSTVKLGGTNLIGKEYEVAPGLGKIGSTYYLSWIIEM